MRSQFILQRTDKQWENILRQIILDEKFLLINFYEEKLKFSKILSTLFKEEEKNEDISDFLRNSFIQQQTLETYLFNQIKLFQTNYNEIFNQIIQIKYEKCIFLLRYSIFSGSRPTVLIQLAKNQYKMQIKSNNVNTLFHLKLQINLIRIINGNQNYNKDKFRKIANKLVYQYFQAKLLSKKFSFKTCNIKKIIKDLKFYFFPNIANKIIFFNQQKINQIITWQDFQKIVFKLIQYHVFQSFFYQQLSKARLIKLFLQKAQLFKIKRIILEFIVDLIFKYLILDTNNLNIFYKPLQNLYQVTKKRLNLSYIKNLFYPIISQFFRTAIKFQNILISDRFSVYCYQFSQYSSSHFRK
ncbi:unnamed protein product [Paramecium sonneborni]|uniref:Uncharacterized protein n=1 Tax=Paramecium sonneborni TaxID=65129 RepID=A0A8S1RC20_9CILI|nr:unnamed protein product [Paramecium sonneborni]